MTSPLLCLTERLESRVLLAFASVNANGILSVVGTSGNNTIVVDFSGTNVRATRDGASLNFNKSAVKGIWINAFNGNDVVKNNTSVPSTIIGAGGNDSLTGGTGTDSIDAVTGIDHLGGGGGTNTLTVDGADDVLDYSSESPGTFRSRTDIGPNYIITYRNLTASDELIGSQTVHILLTPGNDKFFAQSNGDLTVDLGKGDDQFTALTGITSRVEGNDGNDTVTMGPENAIQEIILGAGNDRLIDHYGGDATTLIDGGSGTDTYDLSPDAVQVGDPFQHNVPAAVENMSLTTHEAAHVIVVGNGLNNRIFISAQSVEVHGGSGNDRLVVSDTTALSLLYGESGNDVLIGAANSRDVFWGGGGSDSVDYSGRSTAVSVKLDNKANDGNADDALSDDPSAPRDDVRSDIETLIGGSAGDYLQGGPFNERFIGNAGNDTIWAGGGNDTLVGGPGRDSLFGQDGNDTFLAKDGEKDSLNGGAGSDVAQRDNSATVKDSVLLIESFI